MLNNYGDFHRKLKTAVGDASEAQAKALAIIPKVTSSLSVLASSYIIYDIVIKTPRKNWKLYHEIMLGMHVSDLICSVAWFFTTWPIPADVFPAWGASGTQATCTAQGFFTQFSVCTVAYSGFLALYYLLVIKYGWTEIRLQRSNIKYIVHSVSILMGLITSTVSIALGLMNPIGWDCWIASVPLGCKESWLNNGESDCIRGDNSNLYHWLFFYLPLWITIVLVSVAMVIVYSAYSKQVMKASRWSQRRSFLRKSLSGKNISTRSSKISQATTYDKGSGSYGGSTKLESQKSLMQTQMILYVGSFYIVWLFPTILRITELTGDTVWYHWVFLSAMFVPSQGFFNVFVFLRPRWIQQRQQRKDKEELEKLKRQIWEEDDKLAHKGGDSALGTTVKTCTTMSLEPQSTTSLEPPSEGLEEKSEPINLIMEDSQYEEDGDRCQRESHSQAEDAAITQQAAATNDDAATTCSHEAPATTTTSVKVWVKNTDSHL